LWSRKNSYAGTFSDSICDGEEKPVAESLSKKINSTRAIKKRFIYGKPHYTRDLKKSSKYDSDQDTWSLRSVLEDGNGEKTSPLQYGGAGQFVEVQTTEITVEFE
jgi:hypothetical protein